MAKLPTPQMLVCSRPAVPAQDWLDTKPEFTPGSFCYPAKQETMELLHMPNPHGWDPAAEDWNLPDPKHMDDDGYRAVRDDIAGRVKALLAEL